MMTQLSRSNGENESIRWYALISFYPDMHQILSRSMKGHNVWPLYVKTVLEGLLDHSPYVVELFENDDMINTFPKEKIILFSVPEQISARQVVDHLRQRMTITFDGNKKGLLHYYQPNIASYFFSADLTDTANWLGILMAVQWFNQIAGEESEWMTIENKLHVETSDDWVLTPAQENSLNTQWIDKFILKWAKDERIKPMEWQRLRRLYLLSEQFGITQEVEIMRFLSLFRCDTNVLPDLLKEMNSISNLSDSQKVDLLEARMKESRYVS